MRDISDAEQRSDRAKSTLPKGLRRRGPRDFRHGLLARKSYSGESQAKRRVGTHHSLFWRRLGPGNALAPCDPRP